MEGRKERGEEKRLKKEIEMWAKNEPWLSRDLAKEYEQKYNHPRYREKLWEMVFSYLNQSKFAWILG